METEGYREARKRIEEAKRASSEELNLASLELGALPPDILELKSLVTLSLSNNEFTQLPAEVGDLTSLKALYLHNNRIATLPKTIGQLVRLKVLCLSGNLLNSLPSEIGQLTELGTLYLDDNQLISLPPQMEGLARLEKLYLHRNDRLGLPPEILGPDWSDQAATPATPVDILAYYFARLAGPKRKLNEAKLLIVGEGEVGKSSLVERLLRGTFSARMDKTEGIARQVWNVYRRQDGTQKGNSEDQCGEKPIRVNVWDFGGQEVMHATHQFFLTRRSLYVIVLAGRGGENQGRLSYWLRAVQSYGGTSPIVIVANKCDEHKLEINVNGLKRDYAPNTIEFFQISCKSGAGLLELTRRLEELIAGLENVNDEVPERFFDVKQDLEKAADEKNYLERAEYLEICCRHDVDNFTEQNLLLRFLHELGTVLNFDDPESPYNLRDTHILNPEWVTEGVYDVLNNTGLMKHGGILDASLLGKVLKRPDRYPEAKRPFIVEMMRKFEIAVDIPDQPGKLLVPELLSVNEPDLNWDEDAALNFEYSYSVLPAGLVPRFIVRMIRSTTSTWRTGAVLKVEECKALVRGDVAGNRMRVSILGPMPKRRAALAVIRAQFYEIHETLRGFKPEERVPLPDEPHVSIEYEHLLRLEQDGTYNFLPPKAHRNYTIDELLNGIETPDARKIYRDRQSERVTRARLKRRGEPTMNVEKAPEQSDVFDVDRGDAFVHLAVVVGLFVLALAIVVAAIIAIIWGAQSASEIEFLGQRLRTWHVGVAGLFLGAVGAYFTVRSVFKSMHNLRKLRSDRLKKSGNP